MVSLCCWVGLEMIFFFFFFFLLQKWSDSLQKAWDKVPRVPHWLFPWAQRKSAIHYSRGENRFSSGWKEVPVSWRGSTLWEGQPDMEGDSEREQKHTESQEAGQGLNQEQKAKTASSAHAIEVPYKFRQHRQSPFGSFWSTWSALLLTGNHLKNRWSNMWMWTPIYNYSFKICHINISCLPYFKLIKYLVGYPIKAATLNNK